MGYTNFKNNEAPALSDTTLNNMQKGLLELVFPIGSTYITQTNTNPSTILGFGTWERLKGKVCLGLDEDDADFNTIGQTGGEKEHTLTIAEMPRHNHNYIDDNSNTFNTIATMRDNGANELSQTTGAKTYSHMYINYAGGSQPHNNLQPYEVVGYMWIRRL